ncbi:hypothetical protein [Polaribacter glomeratus]|uniref:Uncharacterized protein n=1 Tax=Polaribacter glomeratus TaxID=102 RepID=A0A2S7WYB8_9FLAO|nr:hypothetical protein [Polaribacter glomeratus]PQJ82332.1 hypothetical protein BTO16_06960 [Polaribacter glomeratus]TXD64569.1 hypothetical protein ESX12_14685 [Polaribacter glomeratus]
MKYTIKIHKIATVNTLPQYWNIDDFKQLLDKFGFADAESTDIKELQELLFMAITDYETNEAAAIVLDYKLSEHLNEGQIDQLSNEMLLDKISEEYPEIWLHKDLFSINQLLYSAFNGKFPNIEATIVDFEITPIKNAEKTITKEIVLKCFAQNLTKSNVANRLFGSQILAEEAFEEANDVIWELHKNENQYSMITSDYWMGKNEFLSDEFEATIELFEEE